MRLKTPCLKHWMPVHVSCYTGSTRYASERLRAALGLALAAEPLEGVLHIETSLPLDTAEVGTRAQTLMHDALVSNGGAYEVTAGEGTSEVVCTASAGGNTRVYAVFSDKCGKNGNGKVFWVRGSFPHKRKIEGHLPPLYKQTENFPSALLLRAGMARFGYPMHFECYDVNDKLPLILFSKCRGTLWFNLFSKDATVRLHMSTPDGAPVPDNMEFIIENSVGTYPLSRWNHTDCRIFVKQAAKPKSRSKRAVPKRISTTTNGSICMVLSMPRSRSIRRTAARRLCGVWMRTRTIGPSAHLPDRISKRNMTKSAAAISHVM